MCEDRDSVRPERPIASERVYEGRVVCLRIDDVALPSGRQSKREVVEHEAAVAIVPLLAGDRVLLVRQWRHAVGQELLEIPAGMLEPGEDPIECARRELAEETGHAAGHIRLIASFYTSPGFTNEMLHLFVASDLRAASAAPDEDGAIERVAIAWEEALAMCQDGRIKDGKTLFGLLAAAQLR